MRVAWAGLGALVAAVAVTGCTNSSLGGTATASPSSASAGTAGSAPACVTGTWRSTSATAVAGASGDDLTSHLAGGSGVVLRIGGNGAATAEFTSMQPMTFAVGSDAGTVAGQYSYSGTVTGTLRFPAGASQQPTDGAGTPGEAGTWQPAGDVTWDGLRLTLKLTEPLNQTIVDKARIGAVNGNRTSQGSNAVDLQPVLRAGTYTCHDGTLAVRPQAGPAAINWAFQRG